MTAPTPPKEEKPSIPVSEFEDEAWKALDAKLAEGKPSPKPETQSSKSSNESKSTKAGGQV